MDSRETAQLKELLYYGMDNIIFKVNGTYFQINSGWDQETHSISVYRLSGKQSVEHPITYEEIFVSNNSYAEENVERFFAEPIFDGKTFWEVEQEIEWVDD